MNPVIGKTQGRYVSGKGQAKPGRKKEKRKWKTYGKKLKTLKKGIVIRS